MFRQFAQATAMGRIFAHLDPWPDGIPTSFRLFKGKPPAEPPIHCGGAADEKKELVETMQLRSAGERSTGRKEDGPATKQLKNYMAEQEGQPPPKACAAEKHDFSGMKKETLISTPFKIERLWTEKTPDENAGKEPPSLTPGRPLGRGPKFPGREELINEGPFPLRSRIAQLATHVLGSQALSDFDFLSPRLGFLL